MLGNVEEWTQDYFSDDYKDLPLDGSPVANGYEFSHTIRGGNACRYEQDVTLFYRKDNLASGACTGFRVVAIPRR